MSAKSDKNTLPWFAYKNVPKNEAKLMETVLFSTFDHMSLLEEEDIRLEVSVKKKFKKIKLIRKIMAPIEYVLYFLFFDKYTADRVLDEARRTLEFYEKN